MNEIILALMIGFWVSFVMVVYSIISYLIEHKKALKVMDDWGKAMAECFSRGLNDE